MQVNDRQENHNSRQRRGNNSPRHLRRSPDSRFTYGQPFLLVPKDTFDNDNGIIHQHTGSQSQTSERHNIQRKPVKEHQVESRHNRNRNRHTDNQRRPEPAKENEQHDNRQDDTQHGTVFHLPDRILDKRPLVGYHFKLITRQRLFDNTQLAGYTVHHLHGVITHFFIDRKSYTTFAVDTDDIVGAGIFKSYGSDLPQEKRSLIARSRCRTGGSIRTCFLFSHLFITDYQVLEILFRTEQTGTFHQILQAQFTDTASRYALIVCFDTRSDIFYLQTESIEFIRIGADRQGTLLLSRQRHLGNAFQPDQLVADIAFRHLPELRHIGYILMGHSDQDNR